MEEQGPQDKRLEGENNDTKNKERERRGRGLCCGLAVMVMVGVALLVNAKPKVPAKNQLEKMVLETLLILARL